MADQAPEFHKAPSFISDVQMTHSVSDDGKAITIAFGNFTGGMLIFRAGGVSQAFEPLFGPDDTTGFLKEINLPVPAGGDLRMTIILGLEGSSTDPKAQAAVNISTVDLTIAPGQPELQV